MSNQFRIIIAGSRNFSEYPTLEKYTKDFINHLALRHAGKEIAIVCGMARGADELGKIYGKKHNLEVLEMPANWNKYGKGAGYRRNDEMVKIADAAIYFWDGQSSGTMHCMESAFAKGIPYAVVQNRSMRLCNMGVVRKPFESSGE
jgi:hypothetical protein